MRCASVAGNPASCRADSAGRRKQITRVDAQSDPALVGDEARLIFDATQRTDRDRPRSRARRAGADRRRRRRHRQRRRPAALSIATRCGNLRHRRRAPFRQWTLAAGRSVARTDEAAGQRRFPRLQRRRREARRNSRCVSSATWPLRSTTRREPFRSRTFRARMPSRASAIPARFFTTLRAAGIDVIEHAFPDHHAFVPADLDFGDDVAGAHDRQGRCEMSRLRARESGGACRCEPNCLKHSLTALRRALEDALRSGSTPDAKRMRNARSSLSCAPSRVSIGSGPFEPDHIREHVSMFVFR